MDRVLMQIAIRIKGKLILGHHVVGEKGETEKSAKRETSCMINGVQACSPIQKTLQLS